MIFAVKQPADFGINLGSDKAKLINDLTTAASNCKSFN